MQQLEELERIRALLYERLVEIRDFRRGTVGATFRRCGKPNCSCADDDHPGHGPRHRLTRSVAGRTESFELRTEVEVDKARREVANFQVFEAWAREVEEVNERICQTRPPTAVPAATAPPANGSRKRGLFADLQAEVSSEVARLALLAHLSPAQAPVSW
ncbi:MAG: DUF6788 family protein [Candidatus Dormibacterales bacterium]